MSIPAEAVEHTRPDPNIRLPIDPQTISRSPLGLLREQNAAAFHDDFQLPIPKDVFIRGFLAQRNQELIEPRLRKIAKESPGARHNITLEIGRHKYTKYEIDVIYNAWTRGKQETLKNLSRLHRLLIVSCIFAAMTQGWDQAAMAGAAIEVMADLGRNTTNASPSNLATDTNEIKIYLGKNTWLLGVTVGIPFFTGALLGLVITDPITKIFHFGRRGAICAAGIFSLISVVGSASVQKWEHLLGFRILLGAGMAGKASIVPILLSETSPKNVRGILLVFWQLSVAFGLFAGSVANLSVYNLNPHASWRYMFIAAFIPALLLLSLILFSPESPRWLLKESGSYNDARSDDKRRKLVQDAYGALLDLRGEPVPILVAGELYLMYKRLIDEQDRLEKDLNHNSSTPTSDNTSAIENPRIKHIGWWPRVQLMFFRRGTTRRAHYAAAAVMISQQMCGINLLAFLADTFFRYSIPHHDYDPTQKEKENTKLLGFTAGLMGASFLATFVALLIIDVNSGRRKLLNYSFPSMALSLLLSALVLLAKDPSVATGLHLLFLFLFIIAYSVGEGPAAFVISAEVFPLVNRELGMSLAVFWNFLGAGILAVVAPALWNCLGQIGVLILFSGTNLLAWFLCSWLVPDTGNEDLEQVFEQLEYPTYFLFGYTCKKVLRILTQWIDCFIHFRIEPRPDGGFVRKLGSRRDEFEVHKRRNTPPTSPPGAENGAMELGQL